MKRAFLLLSVLFIVSCSEREAEILSPSGNFKAYLSIHEGVDSHPVWVVNIRANDDEVQLIEFMNDYPANLMAYIAWDNQSNLWFYSSDDGSYFYWELNQNRWQMNSWSLLLSSPLYPPEELEGQIEGNRRN